MTEVVSVKFKSKGKVYYFDPAGKQINKGQFVIVETLKGLEYAECVCGNHEVDDSSVIPPLRPVVRIATEEDMARAKLHKEKEAEAFEICREKIKAHDLDMKLVDVEYSFDGSKILFCFTSDSRVDFRELVKDLAATFKVRIELRQIGVRDEARMLGGLGICGKPFCCAQFLDDFQPVSIKMAKTQGLSLNPTKISGACGRLMCCLKYEQDAYEDLVKKSPKVDAFVDTPDGKGMVTDVNLLRGRVRVKLENQSDLAVRSFDSEEVTVLGGKAQRAEYLAAVADGRIVEEPRKSRPQREPVKTQPEFEFDYSRYQKDPEPQPEETTAEQAPKRDNRNNRSRRPKVQEQKQEQNASEESAQAPAPEKSNKSRRRRGKGTKKPDNRSKANVPAETDRVKAQTAEAKEQPKPDNRKKYYRRKNNKKPQNKQNNK